MVKLPWGLCPPLQVWAQKSLPGRILAGMSLADGGVNRKSDNPQPGGGRGWRLRYQVDLDSILRCFSIPIECQSSPQLPFSKCSQCSLVSCYHPTTAQAIRSMLVFLGQTLCFFSPGEEREAGTPLLRFPFLRTIVFYERCKNHQLPKLQTLQ